MALLPATLALVWGRRLFRLADDPAFPERLLANRNRTSFVCFFSIALLMTTATEHLGWALPLLITMRMAAGYRLRKLLHGETWSLAAYYSFFVRLMVAGYGFWILLSTLPVLSMLAGTADWMVGGALAVVLLSWGAAYSAVFRRVLGTKPVSDPVLVARFAAMLTDGGLSGVRLEQVEMRGGVFANAAALPSIRQPAVVVSDTLLSRLDRDEATAILGHEIAHLEHYNPRRLRRQRVIVSALICLGALLAPVVRLTVPQASTAMLYLWPICLFVTLVVRARHRQAHETASDLRALALTGDADALVRALTKLHVFARLPRRWDTEFERHATHPSLARRIQAIRAAAGTPPASLGEDATFTGFEGAAVTFHQDRLVWSESPSASLSIDYGHLTMLRVDARTSGAPRLVAEDGANRRWELRLRSGDVARAQATLDVIDTRLGRAAAPPVVSVPLVRMIAVLVTLAGVTTGHLSVALLGCFAMLQPASALTAAAGAAAVGAAALIWRDDVLWSSNAQPWMALVLLVCGLTLMAMRLANRAERPPAIGPRLVAILALVVTLLWGAIALSGMDAIGLHRSAREWPAATVLMFGLAGALAFDVSRRARLAALPLTAAGLAAVFLGSTGFADRFGTDPFLTALTPMTVTTLAADAAAEFSVPFQVTGMWLSPAGTHVAFASEDEEEDTTIHAGRVGGPLTDFSADEAIFVGEGRLLLVEHKRGATLLRVVDLDGNHQDVWSRRSLLSSASVRFDRSSSEWRLLGWSSDRDIASEVGRFGNEPAREERWIAPTRDMYNVNALAVAGGRVLVLETRALPRLRRRGFLVRWAAALQFGSRMESRFWTVSDRGRSAFATSQLDVRCRSASGDDARATCTAFDGVRTGLFSLDPANPQPVALASMMGHFFLRADSGRDWVAGWWNGALVALRASTRDVIRIERRTAEWPSQVAIADTVLGVASTNRGNGSIIRLYPVASNLTHR